MAGSGRERRPRAVRARRSREPWSSSLTLADGVAGDDSVVWTIDIGAGDLQKYSSTDEFYVLLVRTMR